MGDEKQVLLTEVRAFVNYLIFNNLVKPASIARAIGQTSSNNIKTGKFGYKKALLIKDAYINNYNVWKQTTANNE